MSHLIDVGGYRLDLRVTGQGAPAVVCLSSAGGAHEQWAKFVPLVSDATTVVTYGRAGLAGSDPLPEEQRGPVGGAAPASELRTLLAAAAIPPPYVLATGSIGGYIADQYAALWPGEVAGLVLIDPSMLRELTGTNDRGDVFDDADDNAGYVIDRKVVYAEQAARVAANRGGRFVVLSAAVGRWLRNVPRPWHRPLTLAELDEQWNVVQGEWAARLQALHLQAADAGHHVHLDAPELVAFVVREVVAAARAGRPVAFDADALAAVGGQLRRGETA